MQSKSSPRATCAIHVIQYGTCTSFQPKASCPIASFQAKLAFSSFVSHPLISISLHADIKASYDTALAVSWPVLSHVLADFGAWARPLPGTGRPGSARSHAPPQSCAASQHLPAQSKPLPVPPPTHAAAMLAARLGVDASCVQTLPVAAGHLSEPCQSALFNPSEHECSPDSLA